jgi:chromosome segregation ATPase
MSTPVTYTDVATAAEQLRAEGRPVGPTKVREMLGRGSFTTVQKYLAEWENAQAELKAKAEEQKRSGPPEEMFAELQKVMSAYWPQAVARAKEEMRPETEALNAKLNEAQNRNKEATVEIGNLENALEAASVKATKMEEAEKRAAEANLKIIALQSELSRLEKIESRFEGQKELVMTLQDQAKAFKDQIALWTKKADDAERRVSEAAQKISSLEAELAQAEKAEARADAQIKSLEEQNAALTEEADSVAKEFKHATIQIAKLETKLEGLQERRK